MNVEELELEDFFSIPNGLFRFLHPPSVPAEASFDIKWSGPITERRSISDPANGFEGEFLANQATMSWSAESADFSFVSDAAKTSKSVPGGALLGKERNGRFFGTHASED
jgi:hypothetical protein